MGRLKDMLLELEEKVNDIIHDRVDYEADIIDDIIHEHKENFKEDTRDYIEAFLMEQDIDISLDDLDEHFEYDLETMMDDAIEYGWRY